MRRSYISPEYQNNSVYGTFNMLEESTFFGAKMIDVDESINIDTQDIIYYQKESLEQLDFSVESSLTSIVYSSSIDKLNNHKLILDPTQQSYQLDNNTRWILSIDLDNILNNYLFATLKKYRSFEGVKNDMTLYNDVNIAMMNYIKLNITNRYKYSGIELYVEYDNLRNQNILKYDNKWMSKIITPNNRLTKIQNEIEYDQSSIRIIFNQDKPSSQYKFNYYFNILFEKI